MQNFAERILHAVDGGFGRSQEFRRVLKAGGILLIYDVNWHAHWYDREKLQRVRAREEAFLKKYGFRRIVSEGNMEYLETCPLTRKTRPVWDENVLEVSGDSSGRYRKNAV